MLEFLAGCLELWLQLAQPFGFFGSLIQQLHLDVVPFAFDVGLLLRELIAFGDQLGSLGDPSIARAAEFLQLGGKSIELPPKLSLFFLIAAGCFVVADLALVRLIDGRRQPSPSFLVLVEQLRV